MIYFLIQSNQAFITQAMRSRLKGPLRDRIDVIAYEDLHLRSELAPGTYVFGNFDLLEAPHQQALLKIVAQMRNASGRIFVANDPLRVKTRYPLLRTLFESGVNEFNVYRIDELQTANLRFPVFVRYEHGHGGSITPLIRSREELASRLRWLDRGADRTATDLLVVEYCDSGREGGVYRKYSAFRVGDRILPRCLNFGFDWVVKHEQKAYLDASGNPHPDRIREEEEYMRSNPHATELGTIFEVAAIDYGRVDYGVKDGRPQVWEINTYPTVGGRLGTRPATPERERFRQARSFARAFFYSEMEAALEDFEFVPDRVETVPIILPPADAALLENARRSQERRRRMKRLLGVNWLHSRSWLFSRFKRRFGPIILAALGSSRAKSNVIGAGDDNGE